MAFKKNYILAIDLGSSSIRIGTFMENKGALKLLNHGVMPVNLVEDSESSRESNETVISLALEKLLAQSEINPKKVIKSIVSIPDSQVGIKQISIIKLAEEELESSLLFEARKHLPVKGDEVLLDYQILGEKDNNSLDLLLAVAARTTIENLHRILEFCKLKPDIIDVPILAVNNSMLFNNKNDENVAVIHCGNSLTQVSLYSSKTGFMSREIPLGGKQFSEELRKEKQITFEEAEQQKLNNGIISKGEQSDLDSADEELSLALANKGINKAVENLTRELQRSLRFFLKESGLSLLEKIYLSGGSFCDSTLVNHLRKELRTEMVLFDPFLENGITGAEEVKKSERAKFTQLIGLALRRSSYAL